MSKQIRQLLTRLPAFIFSTPAAPTGLPAPFVPANTSCDSASAGNKCPSFTVCWLIYNNYTSLCSRENDQIVWDESIKSLLSGGVSLLGSRSRSGERAQKQRRASERRAFYRRQTAQIQRVHSQMLRKEPLTVKPSVSVSTNWAAAISPITTSYQWLLIAEKPHFDTQLSL